MRFSIFALLITGLLFTTPSQSATHNIAEDRILQLQWSTDGNLLALATDRGVRLYDAELTLNQTILPDTFIASVDWHPDSSELALVTTDHVEIWSRDDNNILTFLQSWETDEKPLAAFWNSDGTRLAVLDGTSTTIEGGEAPLYPGYLASIIIWETSTWTMVTQTNYEYMVDFGSETRTLDWSPIDPYTLAFGGRNGYIQDNQIYVTDLRLFIVNSESGAVVHNFDVQDTAINTVAWQPDGIGILVGGDVNAKVLNPLTGERVYRYSELNTYSQDWRSDGAYVLLNSAIYARAMSDYPLMRLPTRAIWHPFNDTITTIVGGEPVSQDISDLPGYIPTGANQP